MLHGSSILASRREERVQKAALVDHHGPGDARLSHSAIGLYGEQSDYVIAPCSGSCSSIVGSCRGWSRALSRTLAHSRTHSRTRTHRTRTLAISTRHTWSGGAVHALAGCSLESSLVAPQVACRSCQTKKRHCYCTVAYECADYLGVQTTRPALAAASASGRLDSKAQPARRRAPPCRAPPRAAPSASERACGWLTGCGWLRLRRPRTSENLAPPGSRLKRPAHRRFCEDFS